MIVDEAWKTGSLAAELSATLDGARVLRARRARRPRLQPEVPIPYAKHLEDAALPQVPAIVAAAKASCSAMAEFVMPSLGVDMEAGTLVRLAQARG